MARHDLGELVIDGWLDRLAAPGAPGGGSAAAITGSLAAALVAMTAQGSEKDWPEASGIAAQALRLRTRLMELAETDSAAYAASLEAFARSGGGGDERRDFALGAVLERAADVPLTIAETACDVALLAAAAAVEGSPELQPDAHAAALLAAAASAAAARLVEINLATKSGDRRIARARAAAASAAAVVRESAPPDSLQSPR